MLEMNGNTAYKLYTSKRRLSDLFFFWVPSVYMIRVSLESKNCAQENRVQGKE